ncbi:MAG: A/G-specific adenine glycosylase, partial [Candidatus Thermoplasmatota archaeon]|nr:A/G-specific adenine glycosylase [Candidatus Thermoplasmatota archaeon]
MNVEALARWYADEARDLPWRATSDPWAILLSEVLLQQTQVARGIEYWRRLLERFPTVASMAEADLEEVMHLWQGAGYYARGRRLHALAVEVCDPEGPWNGALPTPSTSEDVVADYQRLPGIGPYTAAAVASIAHEVPAAVVDGNVRRVVARQTATLQPTAGHVTSLAQAWMDDAHAQNVAPSVWNQAVMELGATVCHPRSQNCKDCPVKRSCTARKDNATHLIPTAPPRARTEARSIEVYWITRGNRILLKKRPKGFHNAGFWELPNNETGPGIP